MPPAADRQSGSTAGRGNGGSLPQGRGGSSSAASQVLLWAKGQLSWLAFQACGMVLGAPIALKLLLQFVSK